MSDYNKENQILANRLLGLENHMCNMRVAYQMDLCSYEDLKEALHNYHVTYKVTKELLSWN